MKSKNIYSLPLDKKHTRLSIKKYLLWFLEQIVAGTHKGYLKHSIDFMIPTGTPIYAVAPGQVVWIKKDSNEGGPFKKYWFSGNRIVIKHQNDEYSAYEHLKYKGVLVKLDQKVKKGQLIGYSGKTGYGLFPHLHFEVFTNPNKEKSEGITLEISFKKK